MYILKAISTLKKLIFNSENIFQIIRVFLIYKVLPFSINHDYVV